jgi:hypothetical protein
MIASLPPDVPLPIPQNVREVATLQIAEVDMLDVKKTEDLPTATPEEGKRRYGGRRGASSRNKSCI